MSRTTRQAKLNRAIDDLCAATEAKDRPQMAKVIRANYQDLRDVCAPDYPMIGALLDMYDAGKIA